MRFSSLFVIVSLAVFSAACTRSATGDDVNPGDDASTDPGVGCTPTSPRTVTPEAFVAPTGLQDRILSFIDSAQSTLDVQMYLFTVTAISDRLVAAKDRGVAVRVLLDPDHAGNANVRSRLTSAGVPNRNDPTIYSFAHAKYLIADGDRAIVMSANFNADAMTDERNYGMVDRDPDDLADLQAIFDQDWASGGGETATIADLSCTRLIVSPNNSKQRILDLIDGANETLEVEALYISDSQVRDAVIAARGRGVVVRVILEGSMDNTDTIAELQAAGIEVHNATTFYLHAKLIIADGVAFIGSENFSLTSLTKNREVGALLFEPAQASVSRDQFDADWSSTPLAN